MRFFVFALFACLTTYALASDLHREKRQIVELANLDVGELCLEAGQCNSGCCKQVGLDPARCDYRSIENQVCQKNDGLWDVYTDCPCEVGLDCKLSSCKDENN